MTFSQFLISASLAYTELRTEMSFPTYSHRQFICHKIQTFFHPSKILALHKEVELTTSPPNQQLFRVPFSTLFIQNTEPSPTRQEFLPLENWISKLLCAGGSRALSKTLPAVSHSKRRWKRTSPKFRGKVYKGSSQWVHWEKLNPLE